jgi:hypothetical protein
VQAKAPQFPGAASQDALSKSFRDSFTGLTSKGVLARVAGIGLLFEACSRHDRMVAAQVLIDLAGQFV